MTEEENSQPETSWLSTIIEGGLPQLLAGPAGKSLSRLLGAVTEIPVVHIEGYVQGVKDRRSAKSAVSNAIAERAAGMVVDDPNVMERALNDLVTREYRRQECKDAVAKLAIEDLSQSPPPSDSAGPSDDWINKFERYAEDASSDGLRIMYAKLLAGEIRQEGSVAAGTLHFVSLLDGEVVNLINRALPFTTNNGSCFTDLIEPELSHLDQTTLEQVGFWTMGQRLTLTHDGEGKLIYQVRDKVGIYSEAQPEQKLQFDCAILSKAGRDLAKIVEREFEVVQLAKLALLKGSQKTLVGKYSSIGDSKKLDDVFEVTNVVKTQ